MYLLRGFNRKMLHANNRNILLAPLRIFFSFAEVEATLVVKAAALGFFSVIWFEGYKAYLRMKS